MNFSLGWITWSPRLKGDSSYRQGFVSTNYDAFTTVVLSTTISVEELTGRWKNKPSRVAQSAALPRH